jgi:outer membrane putative beta-barrel porin/alpha-amylase
VRLRVTPLQVRWRLAIAALFCAASSNTGLAQSGGEEIITDRPDITESAVVVPKASLQAENGFTWTNDRLSSIATLCQTLLRLGLSDRTELRLTLPSYSLNFSQGLASGVTDISIGFKQQLGPLPGGIDLSLIVAASVPSGSVDKTTHRLDPFMKVPWSRETARWS